MNSFTQYLLPAVLSAENQLHVLSNCIKLYTYFLLPRLFSPLTLYLLLGKTYNAKWSYNFWQFLKKFILFCVTLDLSDNLAEMRIAKN